MAGCITWRLEVACVSVWAFLSVYGNRCEEILKRRKHWEEIEWFKMKIALTNCTILYKTNPSLFSVNEVCSTALSISRLFLSLVRLVFLLFSLACRQYQNETSAFLGNGSFKEIYTEVLG